MTERSNDIGTIEQAGVAVTV